MRGRRGSARRASATQPLIASKGSPERVCRGKRGGGLPYAGYAFTKPAIAEIKSFISSGISSTVIALIIFEGATLTENSA